MTRNGFSISDSGYVYRRTKSKRGLGTRVDAAPRLGHISDLLRERTPGGELVRNWWTVYVAELEKQFPSAIADGRSHGRCGSAPIKGSAVKSNAQ